MSQAEKRESFVFYRSFIDTINMAPEEQQLEYLKALILCALGDKDVKEVPLPVALVINQMLVNVEHAKERYSKSIEDGAKGGRPSKWIDQEEAEKLFAELGTWEAVAEKLGVGRETLRKARYAWDSQKPKNPNVNDNGNVNANANVNANVNVNETLVLTNNNKNKKPSGDLPTVSPADLEKKPKNFGEWQSEPYAIGSEWFRDFKDTDGVEKVWQIR